MVAEILREYGLTVTEDQCAKEKTKVLKERKVTHQEHFARIFDCQAEIFRSNLDTAFEIETIPGTIIGSLQRMLSAKLDLKDGKKFTVISDKQSGLVKAIQTVILEAEHRQCSRHIMDNWKRRSHDMELQRLFWKIARSYTVGEFNGYMLELKNYNPSAYDSLLKTNPRTWSRAFFKVGSCCNDTLNNLSESFNRTIRQARRKPLLEMLEDIRRQCMVHNAKRYIIACRLKTRFTKRAHAEIEKMIVGEQACERWMARHNKHEIKHGDMIYEVDMSARTCGCIKWQMTGIPCVHVASVIIEKKEKVEDYVVDWYTERMWELTY
ncbi:PREDICTED: uncharacterized protein LOC104783626 [Camelina sativa]|uniref:Uncharacterized protein LOC104783626 n=1 Tax=Camelina sativa TaxID=90675 RepID=A0ABM0YWU4_CAMSA|nr:PREDICTED: uncharacterized protein LOC104783626 [Camelina sativa]